MPQSTHAQTLTLTPSIQISVINESTVLADADVVPVVAALQKQVTTDFRPVWGTDAELTIVPKGTRPANGIARFLLPPWLRRGDWRTRRTRPRSGWDGTRCEHFRLLE